MSYHKILKTSPEYTAALKSAREIAKNISKTLGVEVFPYRWEIHQVERAQFKYHKFDETPPQINRCEWEQNFRKNESYS